MSASIKTFTGGCHCGHIRYSVDLDTSDAKATKCNCSICLKTNRLALMVRPEKGEQFKLVSPKSMEDLDEYTFGSKLQHQYFCKTCGIHCLVVGSYEWEGKVVHNMGINAVTLDPDQLDLRTLKVQYWDGKGNNWQAGLGDEPYPGVVINVQETRES